MKTNSYRNLALAALLTLTAALPAVAANSSRYGAEIRKTEVSGYTLTYTLIDVPTMNQTSVMPETSSDGGRQKSHHLMVFVTRPDGRAVKDIDVGFVVAKPNSSGDAFPAFRMDGGAGTDVDLPFRGDYPITAKIALPDKDLVDAFVYTVK